MEKTTEVGKLRKRLTPVASAKMQEAMRKKALSLRNLAEVSGLAMPVVTKYVRQLQGAEMAFVADWEADSRGYMTIEKYKFGKGEDVPCPKSTRTAADRMKDVRAKRKAAS